MRVRLSLTIILAGVISLLAGNAQATCSTPYAGPAEPNPPYYFSSACFKQSSTRIMLTNKVCSVSTGNRGFKWTKLNWVSGWQPLRPGHCLVRGDYYPKVLDIPGSVLYVSGEQNQVTNVYVPDLGHGNNAAYDKTIDGEAPNVEGGAEEPFHFAVSYSPKATGVAIHATLTGQNPVFYLVLPRQINSREALEKYVDSSYLKKLLPLIRFHSDVLAGATSKDDVILYEYYDHRELHNRTVLVSPPAKTRTSVTFSVKRTDEFRRDIKRMVACIGINSHIVACL